MASKSKTACNPPTFMLRDHPDFGKASIESSKVQFKECAQTVILHSCLTRDKQSALYARKQVVSYRPIVHAETHLRSYCMW